MMGIQLALGRSCITFKPPSFKLKSVKIYGDHGTQVPSLQYAIHQEHKSEEVSLAYKEENQNVVSSGSLLPQVFSSLRTFKANHLKSHSDFQTVLL